MKVYSLYFSEDGVGSDVYTNAKAIYNGINKTYYKPLTIYIGDKSLKYSYENVVKAINLSSKDGKYYAYFLIECKSDYSIMVKEHKIVKS